MNDFKNIHVGELIKKRVIELGVEERRIANFLHCDEHEIISMYDAKSLDSEILLRWSKLLEYDFFRIYSQHLILFSPPAKSVKNSKKESILPKFRKNIYTIEVINFLLNLISTGEKTAELIVKEYGIPKSTLNKWTRKYDFSVQDQISKE